MARYFVTATGTEVGKTYLTAVLCRGLRAEGRAVRALKPVISGFEADDCADSDTARLLEALGDPITPANIAALSPWRFRAPLSPDTAAAREGRSIDFTRLVAFGKCANDELLLIEGVGGAMAPLTDTHTVMDWMVALGAPAIVVAGSYLGTISHTLTTVAAMQSRGIAIAAVVISESAQSPMPVQETVAVVARFLTGIDVLTLARGATVLPELIL
ncbi:MAG: dethiobiotin synthetase [Gammaproteobacteria bacterium]|jgi:dethiobiotin synthetase